MSHIVTIATQVRDRGAVLAARRRQRLPQPIDGVHRLFAGEVTGLGLQLPQWRYPIVCQLDTGKVVYDNYGGRWGRREHLDRFLQLYAVEKAKLEARRKGHRVIESTLEDGSIKLTIEMGGAA